MFIKKISEIESFVAGDHTELKEVLNPGNLQINIKYSLAHALVRPGQTTLAHRLKSSETYYILSGKGEVCINNEIQIVGESELIYIPPMAQQSIKNIGDIDLVFLCICDPAWKKEDEVLG